LIELIELLKKKKARFLAVYLAFFINLIFFFNIIRKQQLKIFSNLPSTRIKPTFDPHPTQTKKSCFCVENLTTGHSLRQNQYPAFYVTLSTNPIENFKLGILPHSTQFFKNFA